MASAAHLYERRSGRQSLPVFLEVSHLLKPREGHFTEVPTVFLRYVRLCSCSQSTADVRTTIKRGNSMSTRKVPEASIIARRLQTTQTVQAERQPFSSQLAPGSHHVEETHEDFRKAR